MANETPQVYARYVGRGEFFDGIPTRDLTRKEFNALAPEQRDLILSSKLYEINPAESEPQARTATKRG